MGEHAPGVQIDAGIESMLLVEDAHALAPWRRAVLSPHRGCRHSLCWLKLPRWDRAAARDPVLPLRQVPARHRVGMRSIQALHLTRRHYGFSRFIVSPAAAHVNGVVRRDIGRLTSGFVRGESVAFRQPGGARGAI